MRQHILNALAISLCAVVATVRSDQIDCSKPCKPSDYTDEGNIQIAPDGGFEMGLEISATRSDKNVNQGYNYYAQVMSDQMGKGAYYATINHDSIRVLYDLNTMQSIITSSASDTGCKYSKVYMAKDNLSYRHKKYKNNGDPLVVPLLEKFFNLRQFDTGILKRGGADKVYHSVQATEFDGCFKRDDPNFLIYIEWYFAKPDWNMEDGHSALPNAAIPLGARICAWDQSSKAVTYTIDMTVVNYHSHINYIASTSIYQSWFTPPSEIFCPRNENNPAGKRPTLNTRYSFAGEYVRYLTQSVSPIFIANDDTWKMFRYDYLPSEPGSFRHGFVGDDSAGVEYMIDRATQRCTVGKTNTLMSRTTGALGVVGPSQLTSTTLGQLRLGGVKPCRRVACDYFTTVTSQGNQKMIWEYSFISESWYDYNNGFSNATAAGKNMLSSVSKGPESSNATEGVEVFLFQDAMTKFELFEIPICFAQFQTKHRYVRMYFNGDWRTLLQERNEFLRAAIIEQVVKSINEGLIYIGISPVRIGDFTMEVFNDVLFAEFAIYDRHPLSNNFQLSEVSAVDRLSKVVKAGRFTVSVVGATGVKYSLKADPTVFDVCHEKCSKASPAKTELRYEEGYHMNLQVAINLPTMTPPEIQTAVENLLKSNGIKLPMALAYYMEVVHGHKADNGGRGTIEVDIGERKETVHYNFKTNESVYVFADPKRRDLTICDVRGMGVHRSFPFGYVHDFEGLFGLSREPVPLPDMMFDMKTFATEVRQRGTQFYHGVKATVYEGSVDFKELMGNKFKEAVPVNVRWYWYDPYFNSEDGLAGDESVGPVPLAVRLTAQVPCPLPCDNPDPSKCPEIKCPDKPDIITAEALVLNYHNHYPEMHNTMKGSVDPMRLLLSVPAGVYCENRRHDPDVKIPPMPTFPQRFTMKAESILTMPYDYIVTSTNFFDYERQMFRYDISTHSDARPEVPGNVQIFLDYPQDLYFITDSFNQTCQSGPLKAGGVPDPTKDPLKHGAMLMPYEIFNLKNLKESYLGEKPCRDMVCHHWVGQREMTELPGKTGKFEVWSTTAKYAHLEDIWDKGQTAFVKIVVVITDTKTQEFYSKETVEMFDLQLLNSHDARQLVAPSAKFCHGATGKEPEKATLQTEYMYSGEYINHANNRAQSVGVVYSKELNVWRFDHTPSIQESEQQNNRESWLVDLSSKVLYAIDLIENKCVTVANVDDALAVSKAAELLYPPHMAWRVSNSNYTGRRGCRTKTCEVFKHDWKPRDATGMIINDIFFTADNWVEFNNDDPWVTGDANYLSRITHSEHDKDGKPLPERHHSVDIFAFTEHIDKGMYFSFADPCFQNVPDKHFRLSLPADANGIPDVNEYVNAALLRTVSKMAGVNPLRINLLSAFKSEESNSLKVGFKLVEAHQTDSVGIKLEDAIDMLQRNVNDRKFVLYVEQPNIGSGGQSVEPTRYTLTADPEHFEMCDKPCNLQYNEKTIHEFDFGTGFGIFLGCFIFGAIVIVGGLAFWYSKRLGMPVKDIFTHTIGASHSTAPVPINGP